MSTTPPDASAAVQSAIVRHRDVPGALLPIFHAIQDALGYIPRDALPVIAAALNLSRAEVHGVVTYYHHFRTEPAGKHVLQVCRAESCRTMGGEQLLEHARRALGCSAEQHQSDNGEWSVEAVYCLGLCAQSPAAMIGEKLHARLTQAKLDKLIEAEAAR